jgi:hypothetical protein
MVASDRDGLYGEHHGLLPVAVAMSAILMRARSELRSRLAAWIGLAVVAGLAAGAVMTASVGARRTDSAYGRFERAQRAADIVVFPAWNADYAKLNLEDVIRLPQVAVAGKQHFFFTLDNLGVLSEEPPVGTLIDRLKVLHGRLPRAPYEAAAAFTAADHLHLHVGSRISVKFAGPLDANFNPQGEPVAAELHVVGIEAAPGEFPPQIGNNGSNDAIHVSPATYTALRGKAASFDALNVRLKRGAADIPAFVDELHRLAGGKPQINGIRSQQAANVQRSIHLQAAALWLLGGLLGLVTLAVLSQLLARQASVEAAEHPTLRALGMTRGQLWALGMMRATAMGVVAAALAGAVAVAASLFTPIGTARLAEPHPGVTLDWLVLLVGAAGTLVLVVAVAAWPLWRVTAVAHAERAPDVAGAERPSLLSRAAAGPALSPSMSAGVRMALEPGRGRTAVPVRSSLLAIVVAVAFLVGALTFAGSLDHLLATPRLYGWNWDAHVTTNGASQDADTIVKALAPDPRVQDMATEDTPPLAIGKTEFDALALTQAKGRLEPVVLEGRSPRGAGEVALGTETMRKAHARVGSTVTMHITAIAPLPKPFRVVGRVVMAPRSDTSRLGSGAVMDYAGVARMIPPDVHPPPPSDVDLRFAPGVDRARALADIGRKLGKDYTVSTAQRPADLVNFGRVQNLPLLLAALVGVLGAATLAHTLLTSIRRRRRDLSILKTLGFSSAQVRWAVAWQATTFVVVAMAIGMPLGAAAGRLVWTGFADHLGALSEAVTPPVALLVTFPAAILVANLIAAVPAAIVGRVRPAVVLRME